MYNEQSLQGLGANIKLLRMQCQVTQQQLARQLGISQTHMSNIEGGRVTLNLRLLLKMLQLTKSK